MARPPTAAADALRKLSIFGALREDTIVFLTERCETVSIAAGAEFFAQGESGDALFVLLKGRVAVLRSTGSRRTTLAELDAGNCFGEMSLVAIQPRNATVRACEDCVALKLRNQAMLELCRHDLEQFTLLQMNLGREIARRLARADETLCGYAQSRRDDGTTAGDPPAPAPEPEPRGPS